MDTFECHREETEFHPALTYQPLSGSNHANNTVRIYDTHSDNICTNNEPAITSPCRCSRDTQYVKRRTVQMLRCPNLHVETLHVASPKTSARTTNRHKLPPRADVHETLWYSVPTRRWQNADDSGDGAKTSIHFHNDKKRFGAFNNMKTPKRLKKFIRKERRIPYLSPQMG